MTEYQDTLTSYTGQLRELFTAAPGAPAEPARRGGGGPDAATLAERADQLAETAQQLGAQHQAYLESEDINLRLGAEFKLLAQTNAELQVAAALFEAAEAEARQKEGARRGGGSARAAKALAELATALDASIELGMEPYVKVKARRGKTPTTLESARKALLGEVDRSLKNITRHTTRASSQALDTLFSLDSEQLEKAVAIISKELADIIDKIAADLAAVVKRLVRTAVRLLLQAYDWVLSLLGKDAEASARKKVQEWVEELRGAHKSADDTPGLAEQLVEKIFAASQVNEDVKAWLAKSEADHAKLNQIAKSVGGLSGGFEQKAQRVQDTLKTVSSARGFARAGAVKFAPLATALPYLEVLSLGVILGLMGYALYAGYDHVDSGSAVFFDRFKVKIPDRVQGVRALVRAALEVS